MNRTRRIETALGVGLLLGCMGCASAFSLQKPSDDRALLGHAEPASKTASKRPPKSEAAAVAAKPATEELHEALDSVVKNPLRTSGVPHEEPNPIRPLKPFGESTEIARNSSPDEIRKLLAESPSDISEMAERQIRALSQKIEGDRQTATTATPSAAPMPIDLFLESAPVRNAKGNAKDTSTRKAAADSKLPPEPKKVFVAPKTRPPEAALAAASAQRDVPLTPQPPATQPTEPSPATKAEPSQETPPPAEPAAKPEEDPKNWLPELRQSIALLERARKKESDARQRSQLDTRLRLLYLAAGEHQDAVTPIESADEHEREFWKDALHGLHVLMDAEGNPVESRRSALALRHLREAAAQIAAQSTLDVHGLAFCTQVQSFGRITEFKPYEFKPDQEVLLYVEVDNFAAVKSAEGYETELQGGYQIVDALGRRIADQSLPLDKQTCRNVRRDYFIAYRMYVPKSIEPGNYTLQLTIEDLKAKKFGQSSVEFRVRK